MALHGSTARSPGESRPMPPPAIQRLARLTRLEETAVQALTASLDQVVSTKAKRDLISEGDRIRRPLLIASGWAARVRHLPDGRRQLLSFLLPGDLIGMCSQPQPAAVSTVMALTSVEACPAPSPIGGLDTAYSISGALEEAYLLEQITRLGRLNALERIGSLLLELNERLALPGLASGGRFAMPVTQEMLGDALGLTSVHVNRMLQEAKRAGDFEISGGKVRLSDPAALATRIGRVVPRITWADDRGTAPTAVHSV